MFRFDIEQCVPRFILEDKNGYAVAKAIEAGIQAMNDAIRQGVNCIQDYDTMPEWRLDELAWEYHISWYDYTAEIDVKRRQIRGAMTYYTILGTPTAVQQAINDVYGAGTVEEWFQYFGEEYHFRITTTNISLLHENREKLMKLLNAVKNVRSVLDNVYYYGSSAEARALIGTKCTGTFGYARAVAKNYLKGEGNHVG